MVTASHNPKDYNGMKLVRESSKPISGDTGLREIESLAGDFFATETRSFSFKKLFLRASVAKKLLKDLARCITAISVQAVSRFPL
nr:hypothetical protein [Thalassotalea sp. G20_0]